MPNTPAYPDNRAVRIFLEYADKQSAQGAKEKFGGRYFGGRAIMSMYFEEGKWYKGDLMADLE